MLKKLFAFISNLASRIKDDNIFSFSAQFSYYIVLGIFPFLIMAISMMCNFSSYIYYILDSAEKIFPADAYSIISNVVHSTLDSCSKPVFSASLIVILWSATAGSASIINGINRAYGFTINRNYLFMRIQGIVFTVALMIITMIIFTLIVLGKEIILLLKNINLFSEFILPTVHVFRYLMPILMMFLIFSAAYKFLTYEKVNFSFVFPGSIFSTAGFILGSMIFSNYISTKAKYYNFIYGNLSGVIVFLIWVFILSAIFLTGAEINGLLVRMNRKKSDTFKNKS